MIRDRIPISYQKETRKIPCDFSESKNFLTRTLDTFMDLTQRIGQWDSIVCFDIYLDKSFPANNIVSLGPTLCIYGKIRDRSRRFFRRKQIKYEPLLRLHITTDEDDRRTASIVNVQSGSPIPHIQWISVYDMRVEKALSIALAKYYTPFPDMPLPIFYKHYQDGDRVLRLAQPGDKVEIHYGEMEPAGEYVYRDGLTKK